MGTVFTGTIKHELKQTLDQIVYDDTDGVTAGSVMAKFCNVSDMQDNYDDDQEIAGPSYASEKVEGQAIVVGSLKEGTTWRYNARTFGQQLSVTREAVEDNKYKKAFDYGRHLKRSMVKTYDLDSTGMLINMFSTTALGYDGVALGSSTHPLPNGGTFSNIMATAMTPSRLALITAISQLMSMPGHDGTPEGYNAKTIVCPVAQWAVWKGVLGSSMAPDPGIYNEINVVNTDHGGTVTDVVPNKYWTNTTTNWAIITDADNGLRFKWKRKPEGDDWMDNSQQVFNYAVTARWARGWSNPRGILGSNS